MVHKINPIDCYSEFIERSSFIADLYRRLLSDKDLKLGWVNLIGWNLLAIPLSLSLQEPLLKKINEKFPIFKTTILQTPPYENYLWHTDRVRGVGINLLISTDVQSHCMFGSPRDQFNICFSELTYSENTFYLFNTQYLHQVINFSEPRYLLTIEFVEDKNILQYSDVYNWCKEENLLR